MWISTQEGRRGSDETFVKEHIANASSSEERAFWMLVEQRMRMTADRLSAARLYATEHPDEVAEIAAGLPSGEAGGQDLQDVQMGSHEAHDLAAESMVEEERRRAQAAENLRRVREEASAAAEGDGSVSEKRHEEPDATVGEDVFDIVPNMEAAGGMTQLDGEEEEGDGAPDDDEIARRIAASDGPAAAREFLENVSTTSEELRESRADLMGRATGQLPPRAPKVRDTKPDPDVQMRMIKGVPRHVYGAAERELLQAGAFADDATYTQGDVVTVALAYLCDMSGDGLTAKQARALEVYRKNSKNAQFETAKNMRRLSHRMEDLMRQVTTVLTLDTYMARRQLGVSLSDTPLASSDLKRFDMVDDDGGDGGIPQDEFYDAIRLQGAVQFERDEEALGRDITASRYGLKTI